MSNMSGISDLIAQIKETSANINMADIRNAKRLDSIEASVNELFKKANRPGGEWTGDTDIRKSATEMCLMRHNKRLPKQDGSVKEYVPSGDEIEQAMIARNAYRKMLRHGRTERLDPHEQKALSSFSLGSNGFVLPPERSNIVLSCLTDPSDTSGLVTRVNISSASISFLIDSARMGYGAWSCEASCFANNPAEELKNPARRTQH